MYKSILCSAVFCTLLSLPLQAQEAQTTESNDAISVSVKDGKLAGQVFTNLGESKTLLSGKVTLIDAEGNTISTSDADGEGNFMFTDVEPGQYKAVGVAGDYAGEKTLVITADGEEVVAESGSFQMVPLEVGPASSGAIYDSYGSLPASSFSDVVYEGSGGCSSCNTCAAAASPCGSTTQSFGGSCGCGGGGGFGGGGGGFGGGGLNFRRLALIGGITAIAVAVSDDDDAATPDE